MYMEPKNYSTIRSILKKEQVQGEKIAPYIFKINSPGVLVFGSRKNHLLLWNLSRRTENSKP